MGDRLMPLFMTYYMVPTGRTQTTQVYAKSPDHLAETIALRRMDERISDECPCGCGRFTQGNVTAPKMASDLLRTGKVGAANHALVWTSMVATRAGITDSWALMNDQGLLHEMAHLVHTRELEGGGSRSFYDSLAEKLEAFERSVPGIHPSWGGPERRMAPLGLFAAGAALERLGDAAKQSAPKITGALPARRRKIYPGVRGYDRKQLQIVTDDPAKRAARYALAKRLKRGPVTMGVDLAAKPSTSVSVTVNVTNFAQTLRLLEPRILEAMRTALAGKERALFYPEGVPMVRTISNPSRPDGFYKTAFMEAAPTDEEVFTLDRIGPALTRIRRAES